MDAAPDISSLDASEVPASLSDAVLSPSERFLVQGQSRKGIRLRRSVFVVTTCVALVIVGFYNVLIQRVAHNSQRQQLMARLSDLPKDTDLLFLGNSLVEAGCDVQTFQRSWLGSKTHAENIALGATFPIEHCLVLHRAFQAGIQPKYVVYGFFDDELNTTPSGSFSDLVGNRALAYYFPGEAAEMYAPGSALKKWELRFCGLLPMISERSSLWGKVDSLRERVQEIGMPKRERNRFGLVQNFSALEAADVPEFERRCLVAAEKKQFSLPVRKIIQMARQHGSRLVLVEMPMPSRHRNMFYSTPAWAVLRERLQKLAAENELVYISAADWVTNDDEFEDVTHLNEAGARNFSARLAHALQKQLSQMPMQTAERTDLRFSGHRNQ